MPRSEPFTGIHTDTRAGTHNPARVFPGVFPGGGEAAVSLYLRPSRFLKLRTSSRGVRWSIGPRWLRLHTGGGGDGVSTGAGPVTWYRRLRRFSCR